MKLTDKELDQELLDLPVPVTLDVSDWSTVSAVLVHMRRQVRVGSSSDRKLERIRRTIRSQNVAVITRAEEALKK